MPFIVDGPDPLAMAAGCDARAQEMRAAAALATDPARNAERMAASVHRQIADGMD